MAGRIRSIKPEILDDEKAANLSDSAWRLWVSMWLLADDHGRLRGAPSFLRARVFWARNADAPALLVELERAELIHRYTVHGQAYIEITGWKKHQKVDHPSDPRIPLPLVNSISSRILAKDSTALASDLDQDQDQDQDQDPSARARVVGFDWDLLAALYPKPNGKSAGKRWLSRHVTTQEAYNALQSALEQFAARCVAEGLDPKYLPAFDRWLPDWQEHAKAGSRNGAREYKRFRQPMAHQAETKDETNDL